MISHMPGAPGMQEPPPARQLDTGGVAVGLDVNETVGGEHTKAIEAIKRRFRRRPGAVGRIEKHDVERPCGRWPPDQRIGAHDLDVVRAQDAGRIPEHRGSLMLALDHDHGAGAARCGLESKRPGSGEEIETTGAIDVVAQPVEQRLAHSTWRRAQRPRHRQHLAAPAPGDNAHGASRGQAVHIDDSDAGARPDRPRFIGACADGAAVPLRRRAALPAGGS